MISTSLDVMLNPRTVAVLGASEQMNYGGRLMNNLIQHGYKGKIFPVNPKRSDIFGYKSFPTLIDIEEDVDLAIVILKAELIEMVLTQCEQKKVGAVLVISAGFREQGTEDGHSREQFITEWSRRTGIPVSGPNCLGLSSSTMNMWATSASSLGDDKIPTGAVGLISHSGATAFGPLLNRAKDYGLGYKYIVSTGNEASVTMVDFARYMLEDPDIKAVGLFIEGIHDGEGFIGLAERALTLRKPIITLKIGESEVGAKAAASHTASMTGNQQVFEALCRQKGIINAIDYDEFITTAKCFDTCKQLEGNKFGILSHSGGIGGFVGDKLGKLHMNIPTLKESTIQSISELLIGFGSVSNPLDLSGTMQTDNVVDIVKELERNEELDAYVFASHGKQPFVDRLKEVDSLTKKPVYLIWTGSQEDSILVEIRKVGLPLFFLPEKFANVTEKLHRFYELSQRYVPVNRTILSVENHLPPNELVLKTLNEVEGKRLLNEVNIATPSSYYFTHIDDMNDQLDSIDFQQHVYVAKIVSRSIIHKSDRGGVQVNISTREQVQEFFERQVVQSNEAEIEGMLLEEMVKEKVELILGSTLDEQFGPVVMVGVGGVFTELFKLVTWRVAPISENEAREMLDEIEGLTKYLHGFRHSQEMDIDTLTKTIRRFSEWVHSQRDTISSVEINPLAVLPKGTGVMALDCVITLK